MEFSVRDLAAVHVDMLFQASKRLLRALHLDAHIVAALSGQIGGRDFLYHVSGFDDAVMGRYFAQLAKDMGTDQNRHAVFLI